MAKFTARPGPDGRIRVHRSAPKPPSVSQALGARAKAERQWRAWTGKGQRSAAACGTGTRRPAPTSGRSGG